MKKSWKSGVSAALCAVLTANCMALPVHAATYLDGQYTGSAKGYAGQIVLDVIVKDGKMESILVKEQNETPSYWKKASVLLDTIVEKQSTDVDSVSGATLSSEGIKNAVAQALNLSMEAAQNPVFGGGAGTKENPYRITNEEQLRKFAASVDAGNDYKGNYIVLTSDIHMTKENFEPIGEGKTSCFAGELDGQGHSIDGLTITKEDITAETQAGLFDTLAQGAVVKNVNLTNLVIALQGSAVLRAGGITGDTLQATKENPVLIQHCSVKGKILADTSGSALCFAGGIAGRQMGYSQVENSGTVMDITAISSGGSNSSYAGGITGSAGKNTVIANVYAKGTIKALAQKSKNFGGMAGGITAMLGGKQYNVYTDCNVEAENGGSPHKWIGAVDGDITSIVSEKEAAYAYYNATATQKINGEKIEPVLAVGVPGTDMTVGSYREFVEYRPDSYTGEAFAELLNANIESLLKDENAKDITFYEWTYDAENKEVVVSDTTYVSDTIPAEIFQSGSGTTEDPYQIKTAKQLRDFAQSLNDKIDYSGYTVALDADIDISDEEWMPIGGSSYSFNGTFDGRGHKIIGLSIGSESVAKALEDNNVYIGLFGTLNEKAVIKNLGLEKVSIYTTREKSIIAGALAGYSEGAVIDHCYAKGVVSAKAESGNNFAAGLLGYMYAGAITNSYSDVDVSSVTKDGIAEAAGITALNNRGLIAQCYTLGDTYGSADREAEGMACVSGLVAVEAGTQVNCVAYGNVATGEYSYYTGMLSGWVTGIGKVYQCYYNKDASMKIGEQMPDPIVDIGTAVSGGTNEHGETYGGSLLYANSGKAEAEMKTAAFVEELNKNNSAYAANLSNWNLSADALKKFALDENEKHIVLSEETVTTIYKQPDVETQKPEDTKKWVDGIYWGKDADSGVVVQIVIEDETLKDIVVETGTVENEQELKTKILEEQAVSGSSAYEKAVSKALEKMLDGDKTDYHAYDASRFAKGDGTKENPYQIGSEEQLAYIAQSLNEVTSYENVYFKLTKDIKLTREWTPIGTSKYPFSGNFDGNGYSISDMKIGTEKENASFELCGLFGYCNGANGEVILENITLKNVSIYNEKKGRAYAGALVGGADYNVKVKNCSASGEIYNTSEESFSYTGGLAGQHFRGMMTNCESSVKVNGISKKGWVYAGGLTAMTNRVTIVNSYAKGNVYGKAATVNKADLGGLVGMHGGVCINCFAQGNVVSELATTDVGEICGRVAGIGVVYDSYFSTDSLQKEGNTVKKEKTGYGTQVNGSLVQNVSGKTLEEINSQKFADELNANISNMDQSVAVIKEHLSGLDLVHELTYDGSKLNAWVIKNHVICQEKDGIVTEPTATPEPIVSETPSPTETPEPIVSETPSPTETPEPIVSETPSPTETPEPIVSETPSPTETPEPIVNETPSPTETPEPIVNETPSPTVTPEPIVSETPSPTATPVPTKTPDVAVPEMTVPYVPYVPYNTLEQKTQKDTAYDSATATAKTNQKIMAEGAVYRVTSTAKTPTVTYMGTSSKKTKIKIPSKITVKGVTYKVTAIGKNAFKKNTKVTTISIPSTVSTIGESAFYGCSGLKEITLPKKVTIIGKNAFYGTKKLKRITLQSSAVKTVKKDAFRGIPKNAKIKLSGKMTKKQKAALVKKIKKAGTVNKIEL